MSNYISDLNETFSKNLHSELKKKINASIFVIVDDNGDLNVAINKGRMGWRGTIEDVIMKIASGYSMNQIVDYITKQYKKSVLNAYFY